MNCDDDPNSEMNQLVNPYSYFGPNDTLSWPRGFPLDKIRGPVSVPQMCLADIILGRGVAA